MKQKVVIRVSLNQSKLRPKVLKIIVGFAGIESAKWGGKEGNQIEVVGDGIDAVDITTLLRKKIGNAEVVSVSSVGEKEDDGSQSASMAFVHYPSVWTEYHSTYHGTPGFVQVYPPPPPVTHYDPICCIM